MPQKKQLFFKGNPYNLILKMIEHKKTFSYELTNSSGKIKDGKHTIVFGERWTGKTYGLFSKTKSELKKKEKPENITQPIEYIGVKAPTQSVELFDNVCSIDISAAYHSAARVLGYFSDSLFKLHKEAGKMERLRAFGATAKKAERFRYTSGELIEIGTNESPYRNFFMNSALLVSLCLCEIRGLLGEDFYFFWVDCVFFNKTPANIEVVKRTFDKYGFKYAPSRTDFVIFETFESKYKITRSNGKGVKEYLFNRSDVDKTEKLIFEKNKRILTKN